jgi:hypothetical protein
MVTVVVVTVVVVFLLLVLLFVLLEHDDDGCCALLCFGWVFKRQCECGEFSELKKRFHWEETLCHRNRQSFRFA